MGVGRGGRDRAGYEGWRGGVWMRSHVPGRGRCGAWSGSPALGFLNMLSGKDTLPLKSFCRRICISLECGPALGKQNSPAQSRGREWSSRV